MKFSKTMLVLMLLVIVLIAAAALVKTDAVSMVQPFAFITLPGTAGQIGVGDTVQHVFTLTNRATVNLPEKNTDDGKVTSLFMSYRVTDPTGTDKKTYVSPEITAPMIPGATITLPAEYYVSETAIKGKYGIVAILFKVEQTYDVVSRSWSQAAPVIIDGPEQNTALAVSFIANTPNDPGPLTNLAAALSGLFNGIFNFIKGLFGWA